MPRPGKPLIPRVRIKTRTITEFVSIRGNVFPSQKEAEEDNFCHLLPQRIPLLRGFSDLDDILSLLASNREILLELLTPEEDPLALAPFEEEK